MSHGSPDYSNVAKPQFTYRVDDLAELAARLTNATSLERRGETIFIEDFTRGLVNWSTALSGANAEIVLSSDCCVSGGFSVYLKAGSTVARSAQITTHLPYLNVTNQGLEARLRTVNSTDYIMLRNIFFDGNNAHAASFRYYWNDGLLKVQNATSAYETVASGIKKPDVNVYFSFFKVVADFANNRYVYVKMNDVNVDVSDINLYSYANSTDQKMSVDLMIASLSGVNGTMYADNIIVTRND